MKTHKRAKNKGIVIEIVADWGVTPCEPDNYWSVFIKGNVLASECSEDASMDSLIKAIKRAVKKAHNKGQDK